MRPRNRIPRSHWDRGNRSRGLIETAEILTKIFMSDPAVSLRPRDFWQIVYVRSRGLIETAGSELCTRLSRFSRRKRSHMQNVFRPWIRALGGIVWWKNRGSKISWHCPFKLSATSVLLQGSCKYCFGGKFLKMNTVPVWVSCSPVLWFLLLSGA
jgi:hypothetical protein